eukprot:85171-Prymnesium_polylepis.1
MEDVLVESQEVCEAAMRLGDDEHRAVALSLDAYEVFGVAFERAHVAYDANRKILQRHPQALGADLRHRAPRTAATAGSGGHARP